MRRFIGDIGGRAFGLIFEKAIKFQTVDVLVLVLVFVLVRTATVPLLLLLALR